jgi:pilus assembly protein FimV
LLCVGQAQALNLGRIEVRSALGEPLLAEVQVLNFSPAQAASLQLGVSPATAYSSFGQANNALAKDFKATLVLDDKGQASIRLNSSRVIDAPFVDFVLEANWAAGRSVRDYTMLFDAPSANGAASARAPLVSTSISAAQLASAGQAHVVKPGETAGRIAEANLPADVSLDQMLLALLEENPQAFINNNVNRLRAGAVLKLPGAAKASATPAAQARQAVRAQSQDFMAYRERLANAARRQDLPDAKRESTGSLSAASPPSPATTSPTDKLTLSKAPQADSKDVVTELREEKVAKQLQTKELQSANQDMAANLDALSKLSQQAAATAVAGAAAGGGAGASDDARNKVAAPAGPTVAATPPGVPTADQATAEPKPAADAPAKATGPDAASSADPVTPEPAPAPKLIDKLVASPWVPVVAGSLLLALTGLAVYRIRQRRKQSDASNNPEQDTHQDHTALEPAAAMASAVSVVTASDALDAETLPDTSHHLEGTHNADVVESDDEPSKLGVLDSQLAALSLPADLPDLDLPSLTPEAGHAPDAVANAEAVPAPTVSAPDQDFALDDDLPLNAPAPSAPLKLDLGGLTLDLDVPAPDSEPMATKLVLAQEFMAMGDKEGARALVDEVLANSSGELRAKAESLLFDLA